MHLEDLLNLARKESKEVELRKKLIERDADKIKNEVGNKFKDFLIYLRLGPLEEKESSYRHILSDCCSAHGLEIMVTHKLLNNEINVLNIYPAISELLLKYTEEYLFVGSNNNEFVIVSNFNSIPMILGCLR